MSDAENDRRSGTERRQGDYGLPPEGERRVTAERRRGATSTAAAPLGSGAASPGDTVAAGGSGFAGGTEPQATATTRIEGRDNPSAAYDPADEQAPGDAADTAAAPFAFEQPDGTSAPQHANADEQQAADAGFNEPIRTTAAGEIIDAGGGKIADVADDRP
jgi:hypothetical protein